MSITDDFSHLPQQDPHGLARFWGAWSLTASIVLLAIMVIVMAILVLTFAPLFLDSR